MAKYIFTQDQKITVHERAEVGIRKLLSMGGICMQSDLIESHGRWLCSYEPKQDDLIELIHYRVWDRSKHLDEDLPVQVLCYFKAKPKLRWAYTADVKKLDFAIRLMDTVDTLRRFGYIDKVTRKSILRSLNEVFQPDTKDSYKIEVLESFTGRAYKALTEREKASLPHTLLNFFNQG
jgi:hypothetical protein